MNKLHFQEIDWVIYFPSTGNEGRHLKKYGVSYRDRINNETQPGPKINLSDVLEKSIIINGYPHTVGLFQDSSGKGDSWTPSYIDTKNIQSEAELLEWIADIAKQGGPDH